MRVCYYFVVVLPLCVKHVTEDNDLTLTSSGNWTSGEQFWQQYGATVKLFGFNQKVKHLFQTKIHRWSLNLAKNIMLRHTLAFWSYEVPFPSFLYQWGPLTRYPRPVICCQIPLLLRNNYFTLVFFPLSFTFGTTCNLTHLHYHHHLSHLHRHPPPPLLLFFSFSFYLIHLYLQTSPQTVHFTSSTFLGTKDGCKDLEYKKLLGCMYKMYVKDNFFHNISNQAADLLPPAHFHTPSNSRITLIPKYD